MKYKLDGLNELSNQLHNFQTEMGFTDSNKVQRLMLVHSEISEAFEAYRKDKYALIDKFKSNIESIPENHKMYDELWKEHFKDLIKDSHEDEIADSIIRLIAYCGENNIDIEWHIKNKMKYNKMRGYKFNGKKF